MRRACFICFATVGGEEPLRCSRGHDAHDGWYVAHGDRVIGLGHANLAGYLTSEGGIDLREYRLLGSLKEPQIVVDLHGKSYVTQGIVREVRTGVWRVICIDAEDHGRSMLKTSTPVRPLPRTKQSPKLLRAMFRAVHAA